MPINKNIEKIIVEISTGSISGYPADMEFSYDILGVEDRRLSIVYKINLVYPDLTKTIYVKIAKFSKDQHNKATRKLQQEFDRHKNAYNKALSSNKFYIVKPLCICPDIPAIATEAFPNSTPLRIPIIKYLILGGAKRKKHVEKLLYSTGEMLKDFHKLDTHKIEDLEQTKDELGEYIKLRLELIEKFMSNRTSAHDSNLKPLFEQFIGGKNLGTNLSENGAGITHGDFTPGNVLYNDNKLGLIDFSEANSGPQQLDLGSFVNFLNMLPLNKPFLSRKRVKHLESSFLEGYGKLSATEIELYKLYQFRYLATNLLTQAREMEKSQLKSILMSMRFKRYLKEIRAKLT